MSVIRLVAPAKINWTLEILGRREDGYHEVRTVMQTVDLSDTIALTESDALSLSVRGGTPGFRRRSAESPETNLAYRAAALLREQAGVRHGADIELHKHIPLASGLGGGSSDAAAVLRGLNRLWQLGMRDGELLRIAAGLGSDVPFFLHGGTALASGRGEVIEPLPDTAQPTIAITTRRQRPAGDKTARMYAALDRAHYTDGARTDALAVRIRTGDAIRPDAIFNAFEAVLPAVAPATARAVEQARANGIGAAHLCGSGPALFFLAEDFRPERNAAGVYDNAFVPVVPLTSAQALAITVDGG